MPIEKLDYLSVVGDVSPKNPTGQWSTIAMYHDITSDNYRKINELIDAVNQLQSSKGSSAGVQFGSSGGTGLDGNVILEIVRENNRQWMELLKFMKDMKLEKQDVAK